MTWSSFSGDNRVYSLLLSFVTKPMSIIRPFDPLHILRFNSVNSDAWTATVSTPFSFYRCCPQSPLKLRMTVWIDLYQYHNGYYCSYVAQWPDFCVVTEGAFDTSIKAYSMSKVLHCDWIPASDRDCLILPRSDRQT